MNKILNDLLTSHFCILSTECVCNELGTNKSMGACNRVTGQCPCLPNVVGVSCDQCDVNTWDLGNPLGCQSCDCDGLGSTNSQCNLVNLTF